MTPVEIIALLFALGLLLKTVLVFFVDPKKVYDFTKKFFANTLFLNVLCTVLFVVIAYYLLLEITVVQLWVAMFAGMLLFALIAAAYPKGYLKMADEVMKNIKAAWYPSAIFLVYAIYVLYILLG